MEQTADWCSTTITQVDNWQVVSGYALMCGTDLQWCRAVICCWTWVIWDWSKVICAVRLIRVSYTTNFGMVSVDHTVGHTASGVSSG